MNGEIIDRVFRVNQPIVTRAMQQDAGQEVSIASSCTGDHGGNCRTFFGMSVNAAAPVQVLVLATHLEHRVDDCMSGMEQGVKILVACRFLPIGHMVIVTVCQGEYSRPTQDQTGKYRYILGRQFPHQSPQ